MYFFDQVDPSGMIYQALKNRATLDDALEVDAIFFIVGVRFYMTDPAAFFL